VCAGVLLALLPLAVEIPALASTALVAALLTALIAYETTRFADARRRVREQLAHGHAHG
jgi:hypothetical protein